ncbi:MAG TPA: hypothetical protein VIG63_01980 [Savagea sp.]
MTNHADKENPTKKEQALRKEQKEQPTPERVQPKKGFAKDGNARGVVPKRSTDQPKRTDD